MAPKGGEKDGVGKEEDPMKALLKLSVKYSNSAAFTDMSEARITAEQRLLEIKLEELQKQCLELQNKRIGFWANPTTEIQLPEAFNPASVLELRKQRLAMNDKIAQTVVPHDIVSHTELLLDELTAVSARKNCEEVVGPMMIDFMDQHAERMARKRCALLRRFATHCKDSRQQHKMQALLTARLESTTVEHTIAVNSARKLRKQLPAALAFSAERAAREAAEAAGGDAPPPKPPPKEGEEEHIGPAVSPLDKASMRLFLRWLTFQIRSHKRLSRFLSKFQWLTHTHRYELLRSSRSLLSPPPPPGSSAQHAAAEGVPSMVVTTERLNTLLSDLKSVFALSVDPERDDVQQYAFAVKNLLSTLHAHQAADSTFPQYDSSHTGRFVQVAQGGTYDERRRRTRAEASGDDAHGADKGSVEVTYLKPSSWLEYRKFEPQGDAHRDELAGRLAELKELDHIMSAEMTACLENNLQIVSQRIQEQVDTHVERAVAVNEGNESMATAQKSLQGLAAQGPRLTKAMVQLPLEKLTPLYQMRHLQMRQARRRLLAILNYFRSIERRVTLDSRGLAFSSVALPSKVPADLASAAARPADADAQTTAEEAHRNLSGVDPVMGHKEAMDAEAVQSRDDQYSIDADGVVRVRDAAGCLVVYDSALEDLTRVNSEMLQIGTYYLQTYPDDRSVPDRVTILLDLYEHEATYYEALKHTVDVLFEAYEHCFCPTEQARLGQELITSIAQRPLVDLTKPYFAESYRGHTTALQLQGTLLRDVITGQMLEERMYRNTTVVRNHGIPVLDRYGFPEEVYQPATHDELLGGCQPYTCVPGGLPSGALDLFQSVGGIGSVMDVMRSVTGELCFVHDLGAGRGSAGAVTALRTAVTQQALVEWRLLMEEEDLTEDMGKKFGMIGRRPYANSFLIDDPFAVEKVIDQSETQIAFDQEDEQRRKRVSAEKGKHGRKPVADVKTLLDEMQHLDPMVQAHLNVIEGVLSRKQILDAVYETEVLKGAYYTQAALYQRDVSKAGLPPMDLGGTEAARKQRTDETSALGADFVTMLAMNEFELTFAQFDFQTLEGLQETLSGESIICLRQALRVQVLERGLYAIACEYNNQCLDRCMEGVLALEDQLFSQLNAPGAGGAGGGKAFVSAGATVTATKKQDAQELAEKRAKAGAEVAKFQANEAGKIREAFLLVGNLKQARRVAMMERFQQKSGLVQGTGPTAKKQVKSLKFELIQQYCTNMVADCEIFTSKTQICRSALMLARAAEALPKPKMVFTQHADPQVTSITFERPLEVQDESGRDTSVFGSDLTLINGCWRIPHPFEIVTEFPQEPRTLFAYHQILVGLHNTLCIVTTFARVMPKPLVQTKERAVGPDYVQQVFGQIRNQVDCLGDQTNPFEVAKFLMARRSVSFYLYYLSLEQAKTKLLLSDSPTPRTLAVLKAALAEATAPPYGPPKAFPSQLPGTPEQQKAMEKFASVKGPAPDVPAPPSYTNLGRNLMQLPEADRALIVNEWTKIEGLMADMLQTRGVFMTNAPAACLAHMNEFCRASCELRALTSAYCGLMIGVTNPETTAETRAFTDCYDSNILTKVLKAKEKADQQFSEIQSAALTGIASSADETSKQKLADKAQAQFLALSTELAQRQFACRVLHDEICKASLRKEMDSVMASHAGMMRTIDEQGFVHREEERKASDAPPTALQMVTASLKREDVIFTYLKKVWSRAIEEHDEGKRLISMEWGEFYAAIDEMAQELTKWGEAHIAERLSTKTLENQALKHRLYMLERSVAQYEAAKAGEQTSMARRIDVAVKDQCYSLLFKIDSLERKLLSSKKELIEMERTVRERLKIEFEDLVKDLGTQLTMVKSQFKEYRESLQQDMKSNLHDIRKEALMKMVKSGSAPIELKRMTLKMAHTEDTIEDLTIENSELKRALLKVRTMNNVKDLSIRMSYDKRLKAMQTGQLETSKELYNDKAETQKKMEMLTSRLDDTNSLLAAAESERDRLRKELELANRNKQTLLTWKVAKTQLLSELEARVKKYEKWSHIDVDKLQLELERKDSELRALQSQDPEELARHRSMMDSNARKEVEKLRRMLSNEQKLKLEAFSKLEAMRADLRWEEHWEGADDQQALASHWKKRFSESSALLSKTAEENHRLIEAMEGAGVEVPRDIREAHSAAAASPAGTAAAPPPVAGQGGFRPQSAPVLRPISAVYVSR